MPALFLIQNEAGGQAANKIEDASAGMQRATDTAGSIWAWNQRAGQWQIPVIMRADGTTILSTLARKYYGNALLWHQIADLAENNPIVGTSGTKAIPGDVLLIPNLTQPWTSGPTATGGGTGGAGAGGGGAGGTTEIPGELPIDPANIDPGAVTGILPGLGDAPPGWPSGLPWPGTSSSTVDPVDPGGTGGGTGGPGSFPTGGDVPPPTGQPTSLATTSDAKPEPYWTTGKKVGAVVVGAGVLGLVLYFATRKAPRRRR